MTIYLLATSAKDFPGNQDVIDTSSVSTGYNNTTFRPNSEMNIDGTASRYCELPVPGDLTDFWVSFYSYAPHNYTSVANNTYGFFRLHDAEQNVDFLKLVTQSNDTTYCRVNYLRNGYGYTEPSTNIGHSGTVKFTIRYLAHPTEGLIQVYTGSTLRVSVAGIDTSIFKLSSLRFSHRMSSHTTSYSRIDFGSVIVADENTMNMTFVNKALSSFGSYTDWGTDISRWQNNDTRPRANHGSDVNLYDKTQSFKGGGTSSSSDKQIKHIQAKVTARKMSDAPDSGLEIFIRKGEDIDVSETIQLSDETEVHSVDLPVEKSPGVNMTWGDLYDNTAEFGFTSRKITP